MSSALKWKEEEKLCCVDALYCNNAAKPQSRCLDKSLNSELVESRQHISRGIISLLNHSIHFLLYLTIPERASQFRDQGWMDNNFFLFPLPGQLFFENLNKKFMYKFLFVLN